MATRGKSNGQNASAELNEEITKLKDEVGKMEKHVKTLETELAQEKEKEGPTVLELRRKVDALKLTRTELQSLADQLRAENTEIMNRATHLMEKYDAAMSENQNLKEKMDTMVDKTVIESLEKEMESVKEELSLRTETVRSRVAEALTQLSRGELSLAAFQSALGDVGIQVAVGEGDLKQILDAPLTVQVQSPSLSLEAGGASPQLEAPPMPMPPAEEPSCTEPSVTPPPARAPGPWANMTTPERMELLLSNSFVGRLNMSVNDPVKLALLISTHKVAGRAQVGAADPEGYETDRNSPERPYRRGGNTATSAELASSSVASAAGMGQHPLNKTADSPSNWKRKLGTAGAAATGKQDAAAPAAVVPTAAPAPAPAPASAAVKPVASSEASSGRKALGTVSTNKAPSPKVAADGKSIGFSIFKKNEKATLKKGGEGVTVKVTPRRMGAKKTAPAPSSDDLSLLQAAVGAQPAHLKAGALDLDDSFEGLEIATATH